MMEEKNKVKIIYNYSIQELEQAQLDYDYDDLSKERYIAYLKAGYEDAVAILQEIENQLESAFEGVSNKMQYQDGNVYPEVRDWAFNDVLKTMRKTIDEQL